MNDVRHIIPNDPFLSFCRRLALAEASAFQDKPKRTWHNTNCDLIAFLKTSGWQCADIMIDELTEANRRMSASASVELKRQAFLQGLEVCWKVLETTRRIASAIATGETVQEQLVERMASLVNPGLLTASRPEQD